MTNCETNYRHGRNCTNCTCGNVNYQTFYIKQDLSYTVFGIRHITVLFFTCHTGVKQALIIHNRKGYIQRTPVLATTPKILKSWKIEVFSLILISWCRAFKYRSEKSKQYFNYKINWKKKDYSIVLNFFQLDQRHITETIFRTKVTDERICVLNIPH